MREGKNLQEKLEAAQQKTKLREYDVTITETLEKVIRVKAESCEDAEMKVKGKWDNSEYILDSGNFTDVSFQAVPVMDERTKNAERKTRMEVHSHE